MNVREDSIHPKSQIVFAASANHLVGPCQHVGRNREADLLRGFEIDDELKLGRISTGNSAGFAPFRILPRAKLLWPYDLSGQYEQ